MSESARERESESAMERGRDLPDGWVSLEFEKAVRVVSTTGKKVQQQDYLASGSLPVIDQGEDFIGGYTNDMDKRILCAPPVIVFGDHTRCFKFVGFEFAAGADGIKVLKPSQVFHPKFLYYFLQTLRLPDRGYSRHFRFLRKTTFFLPPLPEQRRIVEAIETQFTRLDAAVAALERARANLERYRASVLQAACEGRLVPTEAELAREQGRDYEPADALLERILEERRARWEEERWAYEIERAKKKAAQAERKAAGLPYYIRDLPRESWIDRPAEEHEPYLPKGDDWKEKYDEPEPPDTEDLPELPEGWCWASMEQVSNVLGGLTKNSDRKDYPLRLPYLRVANVYADELRLDEIKQIGVKKSELDRVLLEKNDLLIVEGNGSISQIGRVAIWDGSIEPCVHQNHLIKIRLVLTQMAKYVLTWLLSAGGRDHIVDVASSTSGLYTLSLSKVSSLPVPMPPLAEQHRIVDEVERRLSVVDALEQTVEANLTRAERLRQAILKKAFEGRLVPQNPSDEPASALLERIRSAET